MYIVCLAHFCELHGPTIILCTSAVGRATQQPKTVACQSCLMVLPSDKATNLTSTLNGTPYVSANYPDSAKRYSAVTKLVLRSLSVETTSDITMPMFYGDVTNGYAIARIFKIKDAYARGSERKYSLLVVSDHETALLHNWNVVSAYFNELIGQIQKQVNINAEGKKGVLDNERYLRRSMTRPRSLVDLTGDSDVFVRVHCWAVELLRDMRTQ